MYGIFNILTLSIFLSCNEPKIENYTKVWNNADQLHLEFAKKRCPEIYPEAPCVKLFRKKEKLVYNVICGV